MKIEYRTPAGAGDFSVLADEGNVAEGNTAERITGYQPALKQSPFVEPLFQAAAPFIGSIGNAQWTLRFGVHRTHADPDAAQAFVSAHASALGGKLTTFDLRITIITDLFDFYGCTIEQLTPEPHSDRSSFIVYQFVGPSYIAE